MTPGQDCVSYQTTEHHFTESTRTEEMTYTDERYVHRVPANWFVATEPSYNLDAYERYVESPELYPDVERHRVESVGFDYEAAPVGDGTGKPYTVEFTTTEDEESSAGRKAGDEWTRHSRTAYLLGLLDYDKDDYEVVRIVPTDEGDGVLVTVQERLPHLPKE
jgi:hypothetical protein